MTALLVLDIERLADFHYRASVAGWTIRTFDNLPQIVEILNQDPDGIDRTAWPEILSVEDGEAVVRSAAAQPLDFGTGWTGANWSLARHINRETPWPKLGLRLPFEAEFECARDGDGVDIYVVDTGLSESHPEFGGRAENIWSYSGASSPDDQNGHGTACAGVAGGGTVGFARGALLFGIKIAGADGLATNTNVVAGYSAVLTHYNSRTSTNRPAVMSVSYAFSSNAQAAAVESVLSAGIMVVGSAGNDALNIDNAIGAYPAEVVGAICAGGIQPADTPYVATNFGTRVDFLAAAQWIYTSTIASDNPALYRVWNGTSFSCPAVAGALACILQDYQRLTTHAQTQELRNYLKEQATWGAYKQTAGYIPMTPAILYLEPTDDYPPVPSLIPR